MSNAPAVQIPRNLLFRYRFPLLEIAAAPRGVIELGDEFRFRGLGRFEGQQSFAEWRGGWSANGLNFSVEVRNKKQSLWCRSNMLLESDSLQIWVDTRDTQTVHRATRYCHWFAALPSGGGPGKTPAISSMLKINRSREDSPLINRAKIPVESQILADGYKMLMHIPAAVLNGWDPVEHRSIGFFIATLDREFGWQTLTLGSELPFSEDPSLWCTMALTPASATKALNAETKASNAETAKSKSAPKKKPKETK